MTGSHPALPVGLPLTGLAMLSAQSDQFWFLSHAGVGNPQYSAGLGAQAEQAPEGHEDGSAGTPAHYTLTVVCLLLWCEHLSTPTSSMCAAAAQLACFAEKLVHCHIQELMQLPPACFTVDPTLVKGLSIIIIFLEVISQRQIIIAVFAGKGALL